MEEQLQQSDVSGVWRGLKTISGHKQPDSQARGDQKWVNDLNLFFNRFDQSAPPLAQTSRLQPPSSSPSPSPPPTLLAHCFDTSPTPAPPDISPPPTPPPTSSPPPPSTQPPCSSLSFTTCQVRDQLKKIKTRKAAGPDGISSRLLKSCVDQLYGIVETIFNLSLRLGRVPQLWKTSCVVPVPKTHPKDFSSFRPVALTSHLMKTLEHLVLSHLRPAVGPSMDPLQFAYQPGTGVDDAVIFLLNRALSHLEKPGSFVKKSTGCSKKKLYAKPVTKAQLQASFFNCKQCTDENVSAFVLRLRELFFSWQEQDEGRIGEEGDDLLIDQFMVGLKAGPIKQELSRQIRRNDPMTFTDVQRSSRPGTRAARWGRHNLVPKSLCHSLTEHNYSEYGTIKGPDTS
ncbi:uncharacterized protein LOC126391221 [Epinephelus moara]|uniref:uncharacterized protein LOC126391221 n=1 Tax=Epinephelus moara TaxID=300413 RepID=UPI00214EF039|nr:uncharacterized protein LOC126391221 [Epinephelus moara]